MTVVDFEAVSITFDGSSDKTRFSIKGNKLLLQLRDYTGEVTITLHEAPPPSHAPAGVPSPAAQPIGITTPDNPHPSNPQPTRRGDAAAEAHDSGCQHTLPGVSAEKAAPAGKDAQSPAGREQGRGPRRRASARDARDPGTHHMDEEAPTHARSPAAGPVGTLSPAISPTHTVKCIPGHAGNGAGNGAVPSGHAGAMAASSDVESSQERSPLWRSAYGPPCPFDVDSVTSSPSLRGTFPPLGAASWHSSDARRLSVRGPGEPVRGPAPNPAPAPSTVQNSVPGGAAGVGVMGVPGGAMAAGHGATGPATGRPTMTGAATGMGARSIAAVDEEEAKGMSGKAGMSAAPTAPLAQSPGLGPTPVLPSAGVTTEAGDGHCPSGRRSGSPRGVDQDKSGADAGGRQVAKRGKLQDYFARATADACKGRREDAKGSAGNDCKGGTGASTTGGAENNNGKGSAENDNGGAVTWDKYELQEDKAGGKDGLVTEAEVETGSKPEGRKKKRQEAAAVSLPGAGTVTARPADTVNAPAAATVVAQPAEKGEDAAAGRSRSPALGVPGVGMAEEMRGDAPRSRKKMRVMANARGTKGSSIGGLCLRWAHPKDNAALRLNEAAVQPRPVWGASATAWDDSRVIYYGGSDEVNAVVPQMYCLDAGKDSWAWEELPAEPCARGGPPQGRAWHTATLVGTLLLVFGGEKNATSSASSMVTAGNHPSSTRSHPGARNALNDKAQGLVAGAQALPAAGAMTAKNVRPSQDADDDDGEEKVFLNDVAVFDTVGRVWVPMDGATSGVPPCARSGHSVTSLPRGGLLVFGGVVQSGKWHNDVFVFDTHLYNWYKPIVRGTAPQPRAYHSATLVRNMVVVFGGNGGKKCFKEVHVLDTDTYTWFEPPTLTSAQSSPAARTGHGAVLAPDGRHVIVYGGWDYSNAYDKAKVYNDVWALDTDTWQWHEVKMEGTAPEARCGHGLCLVRTAEGKHAAVVVGGQLLGEIKSNSVHAILFDE